MGKDIMLLDCTLRDGGLGLEDACKNKLSDVVFSLDDINRVTHFLKKSGVEIIELGSIELSKEDKTPFAIYQDVQHISKQIPADRSPNQMYVGLFRGPDTPIEDIPNWNPSLVDGLRVIIRYSELQKSMDFCAALAKKGYKVFVQPMLTMRYTEEELDLIIRESNNMNAYAVYFVDSYGYMQEQDVLRFVKKYDEGLKPGIRIGFHAHNNMNLAYANAISFIQNQTRRNLVCDTCAIGMGQGAGNLQTELIVPYMMREFGKKYDFAAILEVCEIIEKYSSESIWGYSVARMLSALHQTAYKYAVSLRKHYGLTLAQIDSVFSRIPEDLRHRYTPENTRKLMDMMTTF